MSSYVIVHAQPEVEPDEPAIPVGFWWRTGAFLVDCALLGIVLLICWRLSGLGLRMLTHVLPWVAFFFLLALFSYSAACWLRGGATLGMRGMGLRVVRTEYLDDVLPKTVLLRSAGMLLSMIPLGAGLIWSAFDRESQGWHDKLADTLVADDADPARWLVIAIWSMAALTLGSVLGVLAVIFLVIFNVRF